MPDTPTVPVELLHNIFANIKDSRTLCMLALVCKVFHFEAERVLYHAPRDITPKRHVQLLTSLKHNFRLAHFVKSYSVPPLAGRLRTIYWKLFTACLPLMVNLTQLSVLALGSDMNVIPMHTLTFQLESLSWIQMDIEANAQFVPWLETQNALKHLRWIHRGRVMVSRTALPHLRILEGNLHVVEALLPGRQIQRLHWLSDLAHGELDVQARIPRLFSGLQNLRSLTFDVQRNIVEYNVIGSSLVSLDFLELVGYDDRNQDIPLVIPPRLKTLVLSFVAHLGDNRPSTILDTLKARSDTVAGYFLKGDSLFRVDIGHSRGTKNEIWYERWENGVRKKELVSSDDVLDSSRHFLTTIY
ncbi:hypothetical protein HYPSUDRAFT_45768 [Hypholoma sublateritium FD-334 SS-4]|uniref:Uncharacterized protein n=1 Tax=Hypholoma sublateritium (strain FD-334 SS-4) TaxID=945553 RepID=A0A0D2NMG6_HYPSF|nr:hypothetical protein HYPSUDRAFT_45768 [Hypholoma sublateritium FD-334 SS-4]